MTWMGRLSSVLNQKFGALRLSSSASIVHAETLDRGQDIIDRFGPTERLWIGVVVFDECGDSIIPLPARLALSIARSTAAAIAPLPFTAAGGSAGDLGLVCGTRPDNRAAFYEGLHELSDDAGWQVPGRANNLPCRLCIRAGGRLARVVTGLPTRFELVESQDGQSARARRADEVSECQTPSLLHSQHRSASQKSNPHHYQRTGKIAA